MAWNVNEFFNSDIAELERMKEQFCSDIDQVIEYKETHPEEYPTKHIEKKGSNNE